MVFDMIIILGLTGSIAMGKTTTANLFRQQGIPVFDADATVHALYEGKAVSVLKDHFPEAIHNNRVERHLLASAIAGDEAKLIMLESLIHPLVFEEKHIFLHQCRKKGFHLAVLDIPLLFETGEDQNCHAVAVVSAPESVQRERVLARPGMNEQKLALLLHHQISDRDKRKRAHFLIETGRGFEAAEKQVKDIIRCFAGR